VGEEDDRKQRFNDGRGEERPACGELTHDNVRYKALKRDNRFWCVILRGR